MAALSFLIGWHECAPFVLQSGGGENSEQEKCLHYLMFVTK